MHKIHFTKELNSLLFTEPTKKTLSVLFKITQSIPINWALKLVGKNL